MSVVKQDGAFVITGWHIHDQRWITLAVPPGQLDALREYVRNTFHIDDGTWSRYICASLLYYQLFGVKLSGHAAPPQAPITGEMGVLPTEIINALKQYMSPEVYSVMSLTTKQAAKVELDWVRVCPRLVLERCYSMQGTDVIPLASTALLQLSSSGIQITPNLMHEAKHPVSLLVAGYIIGTGVVETMAAMMDATADDIEISDWRDPFITHGRLDVLTVIPDLPFTVPAPEMVGGDGISATRLWMTPDEYINVGAQLGWEVSDSGERRPTKLFDFLATMVDGTNTIPWSLGMWHLKFDLMMDLISKGIIQHFKIENQLGIEGEEVDVIREIFTELTPQQRDMLRTVIVTSDDDQEDSTLDWFADMLFVTPFDEIIGDDEEWQEHYNEEDPMYQLGNGVVCLYNTGDEYSELYVDYGNLRYRPLHLSNGYERVWDIDWDAAMAIPNVRAGLVPTAPLLITMGWRHFMGKPDAYISAKLAIIKTLLM